jgi:hypothetical protein
MSGTENNETGTLNERLRLGAGFTAADRPRAFSGPCPHLRRTLLDGNTTRSTSMCH